MTVIAFTHKINKEEKERAKNWLGLLEYDYKLYNIPQFKPKDIINDNDIVIVFGKPLEIHIDQVIKEKKLVNIQKVALPKLGSLENKKVNKDNRISARDRLQELKKYIDENRYHPPKVVVQEEDLPDLDAIQILMLQKMTEQEGRTSCFQTTRNNKTIEIGFESMESKADIFITFTELYTIRSIMDVLDVQEVSIVESTKTDRN